MDAAGIIIYHNGVCSKCRGALEIMQEQGIPHRVRWYVVEPITKSELNDLLHKLGMQPSQLLRTNEPVYKEQYEGKIISEEEWKDILINNPDLLQRPILVKGDKAIIARPPERVFELTGPLSSHIA